MSVCSSLITSSIERLPIRTILAVLGQKVLELERRSLMAPMTRPFYFFRPTYLARGSQTIEWVFLMGKRFFFWHQESPSLRTAHSARLQRPVHPGFLVRSGSNTLGNERWCVKNVFPSCSTHGFMDEREVQDLQRVVAEGEVAWMMLCYAWQCVSMMVERRKG